jgi:hypothetical protein
VPGLIRWCWRSRTWYPFIDFATADPAAFPDLLLDQLIEFRLHSRRQTMGQVFYTSPAILNFWEPRYEMWWCPKTTQGLSPILQDTSNDLSIKVFAEEWWKIAEQIHERPELATEMVNLLISGSCKTTVPPG